MEEGGGRVPVVMVRKNLLDMLQCAEAEGYSVRSSREGDRENWLLIQKAAEDSLESKEELFAKEFGIDSVELRRRQFYICNEAGKAVATITAWRNGHFSDDNYGCVHWVAVEPGSQGRGLSNMLVSACLMRLKEMGYDGAYLNTASARIPALALYLKFGFVPYARDEREVEAWGGVAGQLREEYRDIVLANLDIMAPTAL